jgi:hypothetical protein
VKPVKPLDANVVYKGPTPEIGDLECTRLSPGLILTQWRLDADEIAYVMSGADVVLEIFGEPIPPVRLGVTEPFCPECIVRMELGWREGEVRDGLELQAHWQFRCPTCRRWR